MKTNLGRKQTITIDWWQNESVYGMFRIPIYDNKLGSTEMFVSSTQQA